eukprot:14046068-Alexandrium_andersonii.AAC.1
MRAGPLGEIPDVDVRDELISALKYRSDAMTQMTREAVEAGVDEETDAHASALLQTLGRWQEGMGVC